MGANRGGIDVVLTAFRHRLGKSDSHALPDAGGAPSSEAPVDRVPVAVLLRHIAPGRTAAQPPQNAIDNIAIILGWAASAALAGFSFDRQQNLQNPPLCFRQIAATHDCVLSNPQS